MMTFSFAGKALGKCRYSRVVTHGNDRGHVKGSSNQRASVPDASNAATAPAVIVKGGETNQRSDGTSGQLSEFGQPGNERHRNNRPNTWNRREQSGQTSPVIVGSDEDSESLLDLGNLQFEPGLPSPDPAAKRLVGEMLELIDAIVDPFRQPPTPGEEIDQGIKFAPALMGRLIDMVSHLRDRHSISPVVLGEPTSGFGQASDPQRVVSDDFKASVLQGINHRDLEAAARLQANATYAAVPQPGCQPVIAGFGAFYPQPFLLRPESDVQPRLADINPGKHYHPCHLQIPSLQLRSR
jgi:hypothetical protein